MKATVSKMTTSYVEIDIPDACPKCGADFIEGGDSGTHLIEDQLIGTHQWCAVSGDELAYFDVVGNDVEPWLSVGYHCGQCDWIAGEGE